MSKKRKTIGKKLRFEVFKRDNFTCQYCGAKAPDVILHVDHISPVSKGGDNDILNLVTSCQDCNLGKGAREISDDSELAKQRAQLEELNERREQLEAMMSWREGLRDLDQELLTSVENIWNEVVHPFTANETGRAGLRKLLRKFGFETLVSAIDKAADQYLEYRDDGPTLESAELAFKKLGGVAYFIENPDEKDSDRDLFYIRGILRNRLTYVNEKMCIKILRDARDLGMDVESAKEVAKFVTSWTEFREEIENFIEEMSNG